MRLEVEVVLVRPKEDGNVGAVARLAKNFGATKLIIVAPRAPLGAEARRRAMAGLSLLRASQRSPSLEAVARKADLLVGTTDLSTGRSSAYLRRSVSPERLAELVRDAEGKVALAFGPEDNGLSRAELALCDLIVHVPARRDAPTLNLSHAAAVVLYALHRSRSSEESQSTAAPEPLVLDGQQKELFLDRLRTLLESVRYPPHKRRGLILLFRRVLGRATPTESEWRMMLGLFRAVERSRRT